MREIVPVTELIHTPGQSGAPPRIFSYRNAESGAALRSAPACRERPFIHDRNFAPVLRVVDKKTHPRYAFATHLHLENEPRWAFKSTT